jgi:ABC-2 type transport system ATP-binding protein
MPAAISLRQVSKSYGATKALDGVTLEVAAGELFGFLGPNGAGKTTAIRLITGILTPDSGEIAIEGTAHPPRETAARRIGLMPESRGLYEWMSAEEYLRLFAELYLRPRAQRNDEIRRLLALVGLDAHRRQTVGTFSRGMKQRLGLARALINEPRILLLDEPTVGLDPQGQKDIEALLLDLHRRGVTIILSSHILAEVAGLCTSVGILHRGRVASQGTLAELRSRAQLPEAYRMVVTGRLSPDAIPGVRDVRPGDVYSELVFEGSLADANRLIGVLQSKGHAVVAFRSDGDSLTNLFLTLTKD